jgi:hypothetical protein
MGKEEKLGSQEKIETTFVPLDRAIMNLFCE